MNGLEAIQAMMEGKLVSRYYAFGTDKEIYKIIDGNVHVKLEEWKDGLYQIAEEFDFDATYNEYVEPKLLTGWEQVGKGVNLYAIYPSGVYVSPEPFTNYMYDRANYFSTREKAEEIDFKQTLFRKLQRFSDENGGNEIDWNDRESLKYFIRYDDVLGRFIVDTYCNYRNFGQIYFTSRGVADRAVELFRDDLIKYFTHDWSGENE